MIDFHTHLLPNIDDGASSAEMAKAMLEQSKKQGVSAVLLTAHYYGRKRSPEKFLQARAEAYEVLKEVAPEGVELRLAAEVHFTGDAVPSFQDLAKLKIEETNYILLELPFTTKWREDLLGKIKAFVKETGLTPVLAHIERYDAFLKEPKLLTELVKAGCLLQLNASAFLEKKTKGFAFALLRHGLVHCLGSDMHDTALRVQKMSAVKERIYGAGEGAAFEKTQENMRKILAGKAVCVSYTPVKKFFGKYF